ncbi:MAG TPA: YdbH domain-containing protein, partial [Novosphingobium sp.]|nr:YdbH domain-containing protein [Novosphingobium sp.]
RDGFGARLAVVAPALRGQGCLARGGHFAGQLAVAAGQPQLAGRLEAGDLACAGTGLAVARPVLDVAMGLGPGLESGAGRLVLHAGPAHGGGVQAVRLEGSAGFSLRDLAPAGPNAGPNAGKAVLAADFTLGGEGVAGLAASARQLGLAGHVRLTRGGAALAAEGSLSGSGLAPSAQLVARLGSWRAAAAGSWAAPLAGAFHDGLLRAAGQSRLAGNWALRRSAGTTSLILPELRVYEAGGPYWLSASHVSVVAGRGAPVVAGRFALGGTGLPALRGQLATSADGRAEAVLAMPAWAAGGASLAVPQLALRQAPGGAVELAGRVILGGPLTGDPAAGPSVAGLAIPIEGRWSAGSGLVLGRRCLALGLERLALGEAELAPAGGKALRLCPGPGGAMLALGPQGMRVSVRTGGVALAGEMQGAPLRVAAGALALGWPGGLEAHDVAVERGGANAGQLHLGQLALRLGPEITGRFADGEARLADAPVALRAASGRLRWAAGRLALTGGEALLEDPAATGGAAQPRFAPVRLHLADLALAGGQLVATASFSATAADRPLAQVSLAHDLASGRGHADLRLPGLTFDKALQPRQLSALAEGIIADAQGTLTGDARFDWAGGHLRSRGRIASAGLDFAAAFGPVRGVAGEVVFTDLLGLVTAPDQKLTIAAINPGIEVDDGTLTFALQPGAGPQQHVLAVKGAQWPFLDGRLTLLPARLVLGASEVRHYELRVDGLNAARFLERMELSNLAATGIFDGRLPLVFDDKGGRIEGGMLVSRPPGGTVSYVGALTYRNLSPMANYAFRALRSLQYREMRIGLDGALAGEVVTRVSMRGVGQGQGASRNFLTRQIGRLPIQFDVNVRAPFMQLISSFRALYDPSLVADPRTLGLLDATGRPVTRPGAIQP